MWWQADTDTPSLSLLSMDLSPSHLLPEQTKPQHDTAARRSFKYRLHHLLSPSTPADNRCSSITPPIIIIASFKLQTKYQTVLQVSTAVSEMTHARVALLHCVLHVSYLSPLRDLELVRALQPLV